MIYRSDSSFIASPEEQREALRVAAGALRSVWPKTEVTCWVWIGDRRHQAVAAWRWYGTLCVYVILRHNGRVIARSLPGRSNHLDVSRG